MKKIVIILAILIIIFVIPLLIYKIFFYDTSKKATLFIESGEIEIKLAETEDFIVISDEETEINSGTTIKTKENGYAHVFFPNNSIMSIDENTEVVINYDTNNISILQLVGNTWHRIKSLGGNNYEVETPSTLATVRGTIFAVEVNDDSTNIIVEENTVRVASKDIISGKPQLENAFDIQEGNMAIYRKNEGLKQQKIDLNKLNSKWYQRNHDIKNENPTEFKQRMRTMKDTKDKTLSQILDSNFINNITTTDEQPSSSNTPIDCSTVSLFINDPSKYVGKIDTQSQEFQYQLDKLREIFNTQCQDNQLDNEAIEEIRKIAYEINDIVSQSNITNNNLDDEFEAEITRIIRYYTDTSDKESLCERYKDRTADDILNLFTETEKKYNADELAAKQFRDVVYQIKEACQDRELDDRETSTINELLSQDHEQSTQDRGLSNQDLESSSQDQE